MNFKSYEFNRKLVHLIAIIIPIICYFTSKTTSIIFVSLIFIGFFIFDIVRIRYYGRLVNTINTIFFRPKERYKFSGSFYFSLSCLIGVIFFSKYIFILSSSILIICDTIAALIGIKFGKHKLLDKSIEGTIAFFVSGLLVIILINLIFGLPILNLSAIIALFIATLSELIANKIKINDNFLILLTFGISYYALLYLL